MAHCRTCGKEVSEKAIACTGCGVKPNDGNAFCQACGAETNENAVVCVACGVKLATASGFSIGEVGRGEANPNPVSTGSAILWFLCCLPIGFMQWNQTLKGWAWVGISILTGGLGTLPAWVDYWMSFSAQQNRKLGEWEFFPK